MEQTFNVITNFNCPVPKYFLIAFNGEPDQAYPLPLKSTALFG